MSCQVTQDEGGYVICRFNNISDLNLMLFQKVFFTVKPCCDYSSQVRDKNRRTFGNFRSASTRMMVTDSRKKYRLVSTDIGSIH